MTPEKISIGRNCVDEVFGHGGLLDKKFPGYVQRSGQAKMAKKVAEAIANDLLVLVEAGCAVGKSFAELVSAIYRSHETGKPVIVVTANILLQEQLVKKDLPALQKILPFEFEFCLMKGKGNYLCPGRFDDFPEANVRPEDGRLWKEFKKWAESTETGDGSEFGKDVPAYIWSAVCGDKNECPKKQCVRSGCFSMRARDNGARVQVIVCNYHVLASDMVIRARIRRNEEGPEDDDENTETQGSRADKALAKAAWLPPYSDSPYDVVICDEAHEMAKSIRGFLGINLSRWSLSRPFFVMREMGLDAEENAKERVREFFDDVDRYAKSGRYKARIKEKNCVPSSPMLEALADATKAIRNVLDEDEDMDRKARVKAGAALVSIEEFADDIGKAMNLSGADWVYCIERTSRGHAKICGYPVDVSGWIRRNLLERSKSVIMTSATLTTAGSFAYIKRETGADEAETMVVDSPFDFAGQMKIIMPRMRCEDPNDPAFVGEACENLKKIVAMARGRTLALFTSYRALKAAEEALRGCGYPVLVQTEESGKTGRSALAAQFRRDVSSVLLATDSFRHGLDVVGESLSCVVMDRISFPRPDDAVMDWWDEHDRNNFMARRLPEAIMKMRQGAGRLIRSVSDRGVVVILDPRMRTKGYGRTILRSLPSCGFSQDIEDVGRFLGGNA